MRHDTDDYHKKWYKEALELAKKLNLVEVVPRVCSRQMLRENYPSDSSSEYYNLSLTIPLVDTVLGELKRSFEGNQTYVFSDFYIIPYVMVASLKSPAQETRRDHFKRFLSFYENNFEDLCLLSLDGELSLWEHHWKNSVKELPENGSSTLKQITFPSFPIIKRALRIWGTMPVTSYTCERLFSSMKLLKTYLRTTITNNRLNALALLYAHPDNHPSSEEVLQRCVALGPYRMEFD